MRDYLNRKIRVDGFRNEVYPKIKASTHRSEVLSELPNFLNINFSILCRKIHIMNTPGKDRISQALSRYSCVQAAYLFGSRARGRAKGKSDLDLALVCSKAVSGLERMEMETQLSDMLLTDVDLVIFHQANPLLQHKILQYGRLVYEMDRGERIRQEKLARYEYLDTQYLHKELGDLIHG